MHLKGRKKLCPATDQAQAAYAGPASKAFFHVLYASHFIDDTDN